MYICIYIYMYIYKYNQRPGAHLETTLLHGAATPSMGPWSTPDFPCFAFFAFVLGFVSIVAPFGIHFVVFL